MEVGIQKPYKFSIAVLETEKQRLEQLSRYLSDGPHLNRVSANKASVHRAILKLKNKPCDIYTADYNYAIAIIRRNLNWLNRQSHIGDTQDVIDEINEVSNILSK